MIEDSCLDDQKFKFILYVSFRNKDEAIALELLEGLQKIN
jgi:hypothetical protein